MSVPRTEAHVHDGEWCRACVAHGAGFSNGAEAIELLSAKAVDAIRAEAAASVRAELAEKVRALPNPYDARRDNQSIAAMVGYNFALDDFEAILDAATKPSSLYASAEPAPDDLDQLITVGLIDNIRPAVSWNEAYAIAKPIAARLHALGYRRG